VLASGQRLLVQMHLRWTQRSRRRRSPKGSRRTTTTAAGHRADVHV